LREVTFNYFREWGMGNWEWEIFKGKNDILKIAVCDYYELDFFPRPNR
jgi:hypothetical protein